MNTLNTPVTLREVGLRDGLQILPRTVPTAIKLQWLQALYEAGLRDVEVGSFVPPKLMPQLADTAELVAAARQMPGMRASVLVPNLKGALAALESGAHSMLLPLSASHAHSLANMKRTPDAVLEDVARIVEARDAAQSKCLVEIGLSTAFGCTIQGRVEPEEVLRLVRAALAVGVDRIGLADTVGYADPGAVFSLFTAAREVAGEHLHCAHFHDTRGMGAANAYAAYTAGIRTFDACVAGIGGCPHAPGASGNVATEDLAYLFGSMGVATNVNFDALIELRGRVGSWLEGEALHGHIWRAGLPKTMKDKISA